MKSLGRVSTHEAMHAIGAISVNVSATDTLYTPDNLDVSGLAAAEAGVSHAARRRKIIETKAEARRRILVLVGATEDNFIIKELNLMLRGVRLLKKKEAGTITLAEQSELDALDAKGAQIEAIKTASNLIEADIAVSADPANFNVTGSPRWPT